MAEGYKNEVDQSDVRKGHESNHVEASRSQAFEEAVT